MIPLMALLSASLARDLLTLLKYLSVLSLNRFDTLIRKIQGDNILTPALSVAQRQLGFKYNTVSL